MRVLLATAVAFTIFGCRKQQVVPEEEADAPFIALDTVGKWKAEGGADVQGLARGLESVTVNGEPVDHSTGSFFTNVRTVRGVNFIQAVGEDERGDVYFSNGGVLAGEFASPDGPIQDAMALRVNRTGLEKAMGLADSYLDPSALTTTVTAFNPIYEDAYGVFGWDAVTIAADVEHIGFEQPILTPNPRAGVLELQVQIPYLEVHVNAVGDAVGIDYDQDLWVGADNAVINANITAAVVNGELVVDLVNPTIQLEGFWYDVSLLPGDIESYLLVDTIRGFLENTLVAQIEERVPPMLDSALAGLDISFSTELLGKQLDIAADFTSVAIDSNGIAIGTAIDVNVPMETQHPWVGYLRAPAATPTTSVTDDVGVSMSDNLLNSVFFQLWAGGLLNMSLDSANGDLEPSLLGALGATDAAAVHLNAHLPPVLVESEGGGQLQLTELYVRIDTPNGEKGEFLDLAVTAFVDLDIEIEGGVLKLGLGTPEVIIDVRDNDWGASNQTVANVLADQLPISTLLLLLGDIEFPLPALAGLSVQEGVAVREVSGVYTGMGIRL